MTTGPMASNMQSEGGYCEPPFDDMQEAHDELRSGKYPEKPHYTSTEKLMKPTDGHNEDDEF